MFTMFLRNITDVMSDGPLIDGFVCRYEAHYALPLGHKKGTKLSEAEEALINKKRSKKTEKKYKERQKEGKVRSNTT